MKRLIFSMAVIIGMVVSFVPANAQSVDGLNLTISPLPISLVTAPGQQVKTELRVKNSGNRTERLKVGLMKFSAYGEEGKPLLQDRAPEDTYFDWVSFSEKQFNAEPNVWKEINMSIDVPPEAALGYYYAVTFARANPELPDDERETAIEGATAILVLLEARVPGAKRELQISEFKVAKNIYEFLPAKFSAKLRNDGNVHVAPRGTLFISRGGQNVATIPVNSGQGNILPDSNRIFTTEWNDGFPVHKSKELDGKLVQNDRGETETTLSWNLGDITKLRFGKYTARLVMAYFDGQNDVPVEATVQFWVIPWRLIVSLLLIVGLVGVGLWVIGRKFWGKVSKKAKK